MLLDKFLTTQVNHSVRQQSQTDSGRRAICLTLRDDVASTDGERAPSNNQQLFTNITKLLVLLLVTLSPAQSMSVKPLRTMQTSKLPVN